MLLSLKKWTTVVPVVKETFLRFPLVLICAFAATLLALLLAHEIDVVDKIYTVRLFFTLLYAALALTSLKLLVESEDWSLSKHIIAAVIVFSVIVMFTWGFIIDEEAAPYFFFSWAVVVSLMFSPYIKRASSPSSFWFFNYQTGVAVFFAGIATIILGAGISLILVSIGYLFEIKIPPKLFLDVWILSWGILFTVYFLSNISKEFDFEEESCGFPKGIRFITNYILAPLMWAYMAILYAYFFKIIFQAELPRGNLGWMITTFGTIGIVTKLLAYPIRNSGTYLLTMFDKYYYYALIVPIILLGIAIGVRINDYGLTEQRYAVVLLGIWFSSVVVMTVIKKERLHIKYVPMIFAVLAFFASFGPWGAVELSISSQFSRFESAMIKHNLLINGKAVKLEGKLSFTDRQSLSSLADYFCRNNHRYEKIQPWFSDLLEQSTGNDSIAKKRRLAKDLIGLMGVEYVNRWRREENTNRFNYYNSQHAINLNRDMLDVSGYDYIGRSSVYSGNMGKDKKITINHKGKEKIVTLVEEAKQIAIQIDSNDKVIFDIDGFIKKLRAQKIYTITPDNKDNFVLVSQSSNGKYKIKIIFESISGNIMTNKSVDVNNIRYLIMLKFNK